MSDRILVIDVPTNSFVIINIESTRVNELNLSRIEYIANRVDSSSLLFNFLVAEEINFTKESSEFTGTILAPHAHFIATNDEDESDLKQFRGQLFVKSLNISNFIQRCEIYEPFF